MTVEIQRQGMSGSWESIGVVAMGAERSRAEDALAALQAAWEWPLPAGSYRFRPIERRGDWRFGRVGRSGVFQATDG